MSSPPLILGDREEAFRSSGWQAPPVSRKSSKTLIGNDEYYWTITTQGRLVEVHRRGGDAPPKRGGKGRKITQFTRASRFRVLKAIARMDWSSIGTSTLITLTYPDELVDRPARERTKDRSRFIRELEKWAKRPVPCVWRCEWKPRLTGKYVGQSCPHFHLIALTVDGLSECTVREWWRKILRWWEYVDVDCERAEGGDMASLYVAKYCAKVEPVQILGNASHLNNTGRQWGITRTRQIPRHCPKSLLWLAPDQVAALVVIANAMLRYYDPQVDSSFTLIGERAENFAEFFWANSLDVDAAKRYLGFIEGGEEPETIMPGEA